ncbi:hypothetical protein J2X06_002528 [Lysobacter niastensis]|uniref:Uncharacterized protein n=2 Tax=Lysobacter niastensis TaxID=380629 RepID=A0ABU1WCQ4_9GAMM|nr:hypothetical protein [Lysobacter niastensis]
MSEDIDLKIISDKVLSRSELRSIRERVTERLVGAGFQFDPNSEEFLLSRNASKFTQYRLPYPSALDASKGLRAGIQIELTVSELRLPAVVLPVSSFVAEALGREPEVAAIPCATIAQTAAEKFVALTRRIGEERSRGDGRDDTLLRHVYDLHVIRPHYNHPEVNAMIPKIMVADAIAFGGRYRSYAEDPHAETLRVIAALREDSSYGERFRQFHQSMVYGEVVSFDAGLATLDEMAGAIATVNVAAFR